MLLTKKEFESTFPQKFVDVSESAENFNGDEFDRYVNENLIAELGKMRVAYVYDGTDRKIRHVVFETELKNVHFIVVVGLMKQKILGHYILDLNKEYGINVRLKNTSDLQEEIQTMNKNKFRKNIYRRLFKMILIFCAVIFALFLYSEFGVVYFKDGGTVVYNLGVVKIIDWNSLSGKKYRETYFFPKSFLPLYRLDDREKKDFENLLASGDKNAPNAINGYLPLDSSGMNDQPKVKKCYNTILNHGTEVNYYLIQRMLCDEPTSFCLPNLVCPLTDGDIAFMLLCDINCKDKYEQKLLPREITEKDGFSAADMFSYLHESRENRIAVALRLLDEYIKDDDLSRIFRLRFKEEIGEEEK